MNLKINLKPSRKLENIFCTNTNLRLVLHPTPTVVDFDYLSDDVGSPEELKSKRRHCPLKLHNLKITTKSFL